MYCNYPPRIADKAIGRETARELEQEEPAGRPRHRPHRAQAACQLFANGELSQMVLNVLGWF